MRCQEIRYHFLFFPSPTFVSSSSQAKSLACWWRVAILRELREVSEDVCAHCPIEIEEVHRLRP
jgi:hypothetical protein